MKKLMLLMAFALFTMATVALADPGNVSDTEATTTIIGSQAAGAAGQVNAAAGNVTELNVDDTRETTFWQGFFGNATVAITLSDGTNAFYSWSNAAPTGELYFARALVADWGNVVDALGADVDTEQSVNDMANDNSTENMTSTYVSGAHEAFSIGTTAIASPSPRVVLASNFKTVFLWDSGASQGVYAAIINQSTVGYDGGQSDYHALLPTDGTTASYYVYAELE